MSLFNIIFGKKKENTSSIARDRLQILVNKDKSANPIFDVIEEEIIEAIKKYVKIDPEKVSTNIEKEIDIMHVNAEIAKKMKKSDNKTLISRLFGDKKENTGSIAKERLQIIVSKDFGSPKFSKELEYDIADIVKRYGKDDPSNIDISFDFDDDGIEFLELNISLPDNINNF